MIFPYIYKHTSYFPVLFCTLDLMICWWTRIFQCTLCGWMLQALFWSGIQVFMDTFPLQVISPNVIEVWEERGRWVKVIGTPCLDPIGFHWKVIPGKWLSNIEHPCWKQFWKNHIEWSEVENNIFSFGFQFVFWWNCGTWKSPTMSTCDSNGCVSS
jgi:hypothetical protein